MRARFILFLLIMAAVPPAMMLFITTDAALRATDEFEEHINAASSALTDHLDTDATKRQATLLHLIALPEVSSLVRSAAVSNVAPPAETVARVRAALADSGVELPQLIAVANQKGAQVVVTNGEPKGVAVEDLEPAQAALDGEMAVTYSLFEGKFYRLTAAPVGVSDGAIILGDRIGGSTAGHLRTLTGADVTFVVGGKPVVSSIKNAALKNEVMAAAHRTGTVGTGQLNLGLHMRGARFLGRIFPIWIPHAAYESLAHTLSAVQSGKPDDHSGPLALVTIRSDLGWTGLAQIIGILAGLGFLLLGLIWMQVIYGPVYRQARSIEAHIARLRVERTLRLTTRGFSGPFAAIADHLDKLADDWTKDQPAAAAPVIREPSPAATTEVSRPIIQRPPVELPLPASPPAPASTEVAAVAAAFPFQDDPRIITGRQKVGSTGSTAAKDAPTLNGLTSRAATPSPASVPPASPPKPEPRVELKPTPPAIRIEPRTASLTPAALPVESDPASPVPLPGLGRNGAPKAAMEVPKAEDAPKPAAISEADIPPELLQRSQELEQELLGGPEAPVNEDEAHYKSVFEEFMATRAQCGEPNDGLTLEKFAARLKKNRDQLVEKYKCKTVRFQVYVKEGKAAVKAIPVR